MSEEIDLGLAVLDHQLLDCDGRRCGNVDDLAIEGGPGETARVVAFYSGPGAWRHRSGVVGRGRRGRVARPVEKDREGVRPRARRRPPEALDRADPGSKSMRTL